MEFLKKSASWIVTLISVVSLVAVLLLGGTAQDKEITGKNGNIYSVTYDMGTGVLDLIEKCDLKKEADSCEVEVKVKVTLKKLGEPKEEPKPEIKDDIVVEEKK